MYANTIRIIKMSLQAMKRKTGTLYRNLSANRTGFSINGTRRNQGYIGQTSLERHLVNTPMKGTVAKGAGGCCGTYRIGTIVQTGVNYFNNTGVVKKSVLGSYGRVRTHFRWIWRPQPYTTVKPTAGLNLNTQGDRVSRRSSNYAKVVDGCTNMSKPCSYRVCSALPAEQRTRLTTIIHRPVTVVTKPESSFVAMAQSEYLYRVKGKCTVNDEVFVAKKTCGQPILGGGTI